MNKAESGMGHVSWLWLALLIILSVCDAIFQELELPTPTPTRTERSLEQCSAKDGCAKETLRIPEHYNFFEIPFPPRNGLTIDPINVTLKARVESIREINEIKEEITLDMEITLGWTDWKILAHRKNMTDAEMKKFISDGKHLDKSLRGNLITINNPDYLASIWKPNLYIYNLIEKSQPKLMSDLITLKYDPEGGFMFYLSRVLLKLSCPMGFRYFPADTQTCQFLIRGFSYNENLLNLQWYKPPFLADRDESNFDVQLSGYEFKKLKRGGEFYNGLSLDLSLRRKLSYHIVQTYIPSSFFILITWLCFLIPSTMVEARIGISMTTLLTLTAMFASVRETSPISSYVKALDIWMVSCIFSVFLTLFEFTILTWLRHLKNQKLEKIKKNNQKNVRLLQYLPKIEVTKVNADSLLTDRNDHDQPVLDEDEDEMDDEVAKFDFYARIVEKFAFAVFFLLFIVYNVIYWVWLFRSSQYWEWAEINETLNVGGNIQSY